MSKKLLTLSFLFIIAASAWANTVTVYDPQPDEPYPTTTYLPIAINTGTGVNNAYYSVSQQLYYASELTSASSTTITAITFYYTSGTTFTRSLEVWMNSTALTSFATPGGTTTPNLVDAGEKVFDGDVALTSGSPYTITFNTPYDWNGTSNIIVTVFDKTGKKNNIYDYEGYTISPGATEMFATPDKVRFLHKTNNTNSSAAGWSMDNLTAVTANSSSVANRKYANKITFTFEGAASPPATPSGLAASSVGVNTATLAWSAVGDATSYKLFYSVDDNVYIEFATPSTNSYEWTGLTSGNTYYVKVAASNTVGDSELSDPISFTTLVPHIHDGISFEPWFNPSALPTSGNYYINSNMNFDAYATDVITLTGNLNLCLNGKTVNMESSRIVVPYGKTLTIYDNVGGGKLTSFVPSEVGAFEIDNTALIVVKSGGSLVLKEGAIENNYIPDEDGSSYAIYSNGTLIMSGAPVINSNDADIYLAVDGVVTLDGALSNSEPYSIKKYSGTTLTSGWSTHMSGENPRDYFVSASAARSVCLSEGEASLRTLLQLSESSLNSGISTHFNQLVDVNLTRSVLTNASFNSFCLPFALSNAQLVDLFGAGYDLEEFVSSELEGEELVLTFNQVNSLVAGKPYLLKPANSVTNPFFVGVTIAETSPVDQTSDTYISFHGTFAPTPLEGGNKNLLFLGAGNELFWPEATDNIKGFRAYFEVKGDARKVAKRARIGKHTDEATAIENQMENGKCENVKMIKDGVLLILRDGKTYNVMGQQIQ